MSRKTKSLNGLRARIFSFSSNLFINSAFTRDSTASLCYFSRLIQFSAPPPQPFSLPPSLSGSLSLSDSIRVMKLLINVFTGIHSRRQIQYTRFASLLSSCVPRAQQRFGLRAQISRICPFPCRWMLYTARARSENSQMSGKYMAEREEHDSLLAFGRASGQQAENSKTRFGGPEQVSP